MISIFLGGYIIYDKVISKEELKENNTEQKEETQQNNIPENNSEGISESTEQKKINPKKCWVKKEIYILILT